MSSCGWLVVAVFLYAASPLSSQRPPKPLPDSQAVGFDVVSIKPNNSGDQHVDVDSDLDTYTTKNIRLTSLVAQAYKTKEFLIYGIPDRLGNQRFDISAKLLDPSPERIEALRNKQSQMILAMLQDRFSLRAHHGLKKLRAYSLESNPANHKLLHPSTENDDFGTDVRGTGRTSFIARHISMDDLALILSDKLQQPVINDTGLAGRYDLDLSWTSDLEEPTTSSPSLFTALREQLGLTLRTKKEDIQTVIVDYISTASPN